MRVVVVLPTYNEAENIAEVLRVRASAPDGILVVDDASPDGTAAVAKESATRLGGD